LTGGFFIFTWRRNKF